MRATEAEPIFEPTLCRHGIPKMAASMPELKCNMVGIVRDNESLSSNEKSMARNFEPRRSIAMCKESISSGMM